MVFSAYLLIMATVAILREGFLSRFFLSRVLGFGLRGGFRGLVVSAALGLLAPVCLADNNNPITLDTSETLFAVLTAMNSCGYDVDLNVSDAQRLNIRAEVERNLKNSEDAQAAMTAMCDWYVAHRGRGSGARSVAVRLAGAVSAGASALSAAGEGGRSASGCGADCRRLGALLERFYDKAGLHSHLGAASCKLCGAGGAVSRAAGEDGVRHRYLSEACSRADIWGGRSRSIWISWAIPNETNARNYGTDYYVVVFPSPDPSATDPLKMEQIRHTYLHYLLDPLAEKHFSSIKRLEPLLQSVKRAPLEESFKTDISLLVTECLVRAIEIRTTGNKQTAEAMRLQAVDDAVKQGYILTRYFYTRWWRLKKIRRDCGRRIPTFWTISM